MFETTTHSRSTVLPSMVTRNIIICTLLPPEMLSENITNKAPQAQRVAPQENIISVAALTTTDEERQELRQAEWYHLKDIHNVSSPTKESYTCFRTKPDGLVMHTYIPIGLELLVHYTLAESGSPGKFRLTQDIKMRSSVMFSKHANGQLQQQWNAVVARMIQKAGKK